MSKIKNILITLMCLVVCFAFASCGSSSADNTESEAVSVCVHNFVLKSETEPDCEHAGEKTLKCDKCGEEKTEKGKPALGHLFGEWKTVNAATCTADGEEARHCTRDDCDGTETRKISAAHTYVKNDEECIAPTCETVGKDVYECSVCHDKYDDVVPALGHTENTDIARVIVEATCENSGYTTVTCSVCEKTYNINKVDALGHNYEARETAAATCENAGYTTMKCSRCDKSYRNITAAKLSHSFGDDGVCTACEKSYLDANALFISSDDNQAYTVRDEVYDYLIYAKDDTSYVTTVTIDKEIVNKLIANRYFKISFTLGSPDKNYRAMGYKLPGNENFTYVNLFAENGFGDNTKFELTIGDENGADASVVTDDGIVLAFLYRYLGKDRATVDAADEEKYHGTLNRFALKVDYVYISKPFDYEDKTTWLSTDYKVTYNDNLSWKMEGTKYLDVKDVTIKAETIKALMEHGYESFIFTLSFEAGEKVVYYVDDKTRGNIVNYVSDTILLTDSAAENGLKYKIYYKDLNHEDSAWGGTKDVEGFTFTLTLNKEFNADDKGTWLSTGYNLVYNEATENWSVTGNKYEDTRNFEIKAGTLAYLKSQGCVSISFTLSYADGEKVIYYVNDKFYGNGNLENYLSGEIALTDEVCASGLTYKIHYIDLNHKDPAWKGTKDVEGFTFTLHTTKSFAADKKYWITKYVTTTFATTTWNSEAGYLEVSDSEAINDTTVTKAVSIKSEFFSAMRSQGYTSFIISLKSKTNQIAKNLGILYNGTWKWGNGGDAVFDEITITDEMVTKDFSFNALYQGGTESVNGLFFSIELKKAN